MSEIVDSYKKVFENKKAHIGIGLFAIVWSISTTLFDMKFGSDNSKQNPLDLIFSLLIGVYSLQFLYNAIHNVNGEILPTIREVQPKILWGIIKLNVVWGIYAILISLFALIAYIITHALVLPIIILLALVILSAPIYYIYLAYADSLNTKGLYNIMHIFKFLKYSYKPLYINTCLYTLITIAAIIIYAITFLFASENSIVNVVMSTIASYFFIVTWYFAFPYSLIPSYYENIKPILNRDSND